MNTKLVFKILLALVAGIFIYSFGSSLPQNEAPNSLVISEGFKNPIGHYNNKPTFSWKLPVSKQATSQTAYRIVVASSPNLLPNKADLWDSGEVDSNQSNWIKYNGTPLKSRQRGYWQVMFRDQDKNRSAWSTISNFELGLLKNEDWQA